jgi:hypothetical protein
MRRGKVCEWRKRPQEHRYIVQMYRTCGRQRQIYESSAVMGIKRQQETQFSFYVLAFQSTDFSRNI